MVPETLLPIVEAALWNGKGGGGYLPGTPAARPGARPGEEGEDGAGLPALVPIVQVIGGRVIKIDGQFDQAQAQCVSIKVHVALWVAGNRGDMVNTRDLFVHSLYSSEPSRFLNGSFEYSRNLDNCQYKYLQFLDF